MNKIIPLAVLTLIFWLASCSQTTELQNIDNELTASFRKLMDADYDIRAERLAPLFKEQLLSHLVNPITFHASLDGISKYLTIRSSADKTIKFYSWDDHTGGTWHHLTAVAQFITDTGKVVVRLLNPEDETETGAYTDCIIYEVHDIAIDGSKHYLTFGWGTHGSGQEHNIMRIFKIAGDALVECADCFAPDVASAIEYPRKEKSDLAFNPKTQEITYNEFIWGDNAGYSKRTGTIITLKLTGRKFVRQ